MGTASNRLRPRYPPARESVVREAFKNSNRRPRNPVGCSARTVPSFFGSQSLDCFVNLAGDVRNFVRLQNSALSFARGSNVPIHLVVSRDQRDLPPSAHPLHDCRGLTRHTGAKLVSEIALGCNFERGLYVVCFLACSERDQKRKNAAPPHGRPTPERPTALGWSPGV
jgi:hypothetical protein